MKENFNARLSYDNIQHNEILEYLERHPDDNNKEVSVHFLEKQALKYKLIHTELLCCRLHVSLTACLNCVEEEKKL